MSDVTVKRIEELESYQGEHAPPGQFRYAAKSLGVRAWGMNVLTLPPNWDGYPEHDHGDDGHEECYVVLRGSAIMHAGGQRYALEAGMMARVGANERRKIVPGGEGVMILAIGGTPGKPYTPSWGRQSKG
jgi:mannose-6-phosphate isomerase-like protein (cupin superfamily)